MAKKEMMAESSTVEYLDVRKPKPISQKFQEKSLADFQPPTHPDSRLRKTRLPSSFWIIRHPNSATYSTRYRISVETPTVRKGTTMAYNVYWIKPTQNNSSSSSVEKLVEGRIQAGVNNNSYYVRCLNESSQAADAMVIANDGEVYVALVKGLHEILSNTPITRGMIDGITPNKEEAGNLTPTHVRGIAHRIAIQAGFRTGVTVCRCLPLKDWNIMMDKLYAKFNKSSMRAPKTKKLKIAKNNPLDIINSCIVAFEDSYGLQVEMFGEDESLHVASLWEEELQTLVRALGESLVQHGASTFREAVALINQKKGTSPRKPCGWRAL